jgi:hypothetical protein
MMLGNLRKKFRPGWKARPCAAAENDARDAGLQLEAADLPLAKFGAIAELPSSPSLAVRPPRGISPVMRSLSETPAVTPRGASASREVEIMVQLALQAQRDKVDREAIIAHQSESDKRERRRRERAAVLRPDEAEDILKRHVTSGVFGKLLVPERGYKRSKALLIAVQYKRTRGVDELRGTIGDVRESESC